MQPADVAYDIGAEPAPTLAQTPAARPGSPVQDERLDDESFVEVEENKDDKMRRIAKTLQAGDVVEEAHVSWGNQPAPKIQKPVVLIQIRTSFALSESTHVVSDPGRWRSALRTS